MIDAHQHFWRYDRRLYPWIGSDMQELRQDRLPGTLQALQEPLGIQGGVAIQARMDQSETQWLLDLADSYPSILGVVGWTDLCAESVAWDLAKLKERPKLKGIRHMLQDEGDDRFMLRPQFIRGLQTLAVAGLTYDLLIPARQMPMALELLPQVPQLRVVLDHVGKPNIKAAKLEPWRSQLIQLARLPNVYCKLSGLVTEADWVQWEPSAMAPYLDAAFEAFGPERLIYGSDWPVCTLAGALEQVHGLVDGYIRAHWVEHHAAIFGSNAARFYSL